MTELFLALGVIAQKQNKGVVLFIDEIQYIKDDEFEALMEAIHRTNQKIILSLSFQLDYLK